MYISDAITHDMQQELDRVSQDVTTYPYHVGMYDKQTLAIKIACDRYCLVICDVSYAIPIQISLISSLS